MPGTELMGIGLSSGGLPVLRGIVSALSADTSMAIAVVAHIPPGASELAPVLESASRIPVREAMDKMRIEPGIVVTAPGGFHLLVEDDTSYALSVDDRVDHSRPSVSVLFESASRAFGPRFTAVVLSGANEDGARELEGVHRRGGHVVVQDPSTAMFDRMPRAALDAVEPDAVLSPVELNTYLKERAR